MLRAVLKQPSAAIAKRRVFEHLPSKTPSKLNILKLEIMEAENKSAI